MRWVIAVVGATALLGAAPAALESAPAATSCRWRMVTTPRVPSYDPRVRPAAMNSVAAVSRTDVWAVGYWTIPIGIYAPTTLIWHWNGKRWAVEGGGLLHAQSSSLSAVAAARGNAWAVGRYPGGSLTEHWNGRRWSATPNPGGKGSALVGVAIVSSSDVWAVGRRTRGPLLLHWNGSKWLNVPAPSEADSFLGVTRIRGAAGVWVYGLEVTSEGSLGVAAWRWMGSASEHFSLPTPAGGPFSLAGGSMTAPSASSAWVVMTGATSAPAPRNRTFAVHWDGSAWAQVSTPNAGSGDAYLSAVDAGGASDAWAVGTVRSSGRSRSLVLHWNGSAWSVVQAPLTGLSTVAVVPGSSDVWAFGGLKAVQYRC